MIAPLVIDLVQPRSVVDVGCATGAWLSVFREHGIEDLLGIDGPYLDRDSLEIPVESFMAADLAEPITIDRQFDLVVSLEVAEHLPPESARPFVKSLADLGPVVLFSAAVPGQGGEHHLNEQWTGYWVALFEEHGYRPADVVRPAVWSSGEVEPWYAQNILLFVSPDAAAANPRLADAIAGFSPEQMTLIHPGLFAEIGRQQREREEQALADAEAHRGRAEAADERAKALQARTAELEVELGRLRPAALAARERAEALSPSPEQLPGTADLSSAPPARARRSGSDPSPRPGGWVGTVLVVSAFPPEPAPEAKHALRICEHLVTAGLVVHVLCKRGSITGSSKLVTHPVIQDWSWRDLPRVVTCLREVRPDVVLLLYNGWVYDHHPMITLLPTVCDSVVPGVACVTQLENIDEFPYRHSFLGRRLRTGMGLWAGRKRLHSVFGTLLRDSARIILLSSPHRARLLAQDPLVAEKTAILPPPPLIGLSQAPPLTARTEMRQSLGIAETELVLLYWGYICPGKGLETLIEACESVCRSYPNVRLLVVRGSLDLPTQPITCEDYVRLVRRLPETLGIADRVTWTGPFDWDSDIGSRYLYAGDICVLPFDYGVTLDNSTLAAASTHGLPVIGTELPAGQDQELEHGRNILLTPPKDAQAMARAIQLVIDSPALRSTLRRGASDLARNWHDWDRMTDRLRLILESAVPSRRTPAQPVAPARGEDGGAEPIEPIAPRAPREVWSSENPPDAPDSPLVSVVVAVYNVEKYLAQCLDALVNQTLANVEILVVNDASEDGSATIIEHYRARYSNIRVITCERNVGLASVRNLGIRAARGQYVAFMDGDDWADISMCEVLHRRATEHGSEVVIADTTVFYDDAKVFTKFFDHVLRTTFDPRVRRLPFEILSHPRVLLVEPVAWTKLYKRAFLREHRLQFEEGMNSYEDMIFHFSALLKARKISLIDDRISYYRQNRPGQISGRTSRKVFEVFDIFDRIHENLAAWNVPAAIWGVLVKVELRQFDWLMKDRVQEADKREFLELASKQLNRIPQTGSDAFMRDADPDDLPRLYTMRRNWLPAYERVLRLHRGVFPPFFLALNWRRRPDAVRVAVRRNVAMFRHRATAPVRGFVTRVLSAAALEQRGSAPGEQSVDRALVTGAPPPQKAVVQSVVIGERHLLFADSPGRTGLAAAVSRMTADYYLSQTAVFRGGDTVVDVGAHVGVFSICLALRFPFLRVYAVEPNPASYAFLLQNIALNGAGNVVPINKAVYGEAGTRVLYCDARDSGRATLDRGVAFSYEFLQTEQVETVSLPNLLAAQEIGHCRLLKICAPGAMREILRHLPAPGAVDFLCGEVDLQECSRTEVETASSHVARHHFWRTVRHQQGRTDYGWSHRMPGDIEEHAHTNPLPLTTSV